nr:uncharacterized protein C1orf167 homolog [Manis javanica]
MEESGESRPSMPCNNSSVSCGALGKQGRRSCLPPGVPSEAVGPAGEALRATLRARRTRRRRQAWCRHAAHAACMAPLDIRPQRAWLCRCFGAWQQFVQRGALHRDHLADHWAGTLKICLQQWVRTKQLRPSNGAKETQLSLPWQKEGNVATCSSVPGGPQPRPSCCQGNKASGHCCSGGHRCTRGLSRWP